jgi:3-dehydroquinate synthase
MSASHPQQADWHSPTIVNVALAERSYSIFLSGGPLSESTRHVLGHLKPLEHAFIIADQSVQSYWLAMREYFDQEHIRCDQILVPSGESSKSIEQLALIWKAMLAAKTDRASIVLAVGGGVIGDLAGYAAASFVRGVRFVQVPTTLLAMVDSSVGGKTGINLPSAKNMVGAFWQPIRCHHRYIDIEDARRSRVSEWTS